MDKKNLARNMPLTLFSKGRNNQKKNNKHPGTFSLTQL